MNDRPPNDWGSIPDWISVLLQVFIPMFTLVVAGFVAKQGSWTNLMIVVLAFVCSFGVVLALVTIRRLPFRARLLSFRDRVLARSLLGSALRLVLSAGFGAVVLLALYPMGGQTENLWLALGTAVTTWLALGIASSNSVFRQMHASLSNKLDSLRMESNASLDKLRAEHSDLHRGLQELARNVTNLEGAVWSYPDGDSDWIPRYDFLFRLDMPTEVIEMSGPDTHQETASCLGVQHAAIYQHPPVDGESDAILRFARQPQVAGQAVLTFYTGIEDARPSASGAVQRSGLIPDGGNRIRFEVYANGRRVFRAIRNTFEWRFHALLLPSLPPTAPYGYEIEFRTNALGEPRWNWAVWGEPRLTELGIVFEELEELRSHVRRLEERGWEQ
jgi:hypothetical protein